jgi:hypothetical protein
MNLLAPPLGYGRTHGHQGLETADHREKHYKGAPIFVL